MYENIFIVWVLFSVGDGMKLNVNQFFLQSNCVILFNTMKEVTKRWLEVRGKLPKYSFVINDLSKIWH